jgi:Tfp pilus assembly protein PilN
VKITGTMEHIENGTIEQTEVDAADYQAGMDALRRTLPEGVRLLSVRVDR